jgi:aspartate racemase
MANQHNSKLREKRPLWGILGGMGPLASTEFLSTIYRLSLGRTENEQSMPRVVLLSDPSVPDRTTAIKTGQLQEVIHDLERLLTELMKIEVDQIAIACVTAHFFLPYLDLPVSIRSRIISLISIVRDSLRPDQGKYLLLRTNGTKDARIFEDHPGWNEVSSRVTVPDDKDQEAIHCDYLYQVKKRSVSADDLKLLEHLKQKYQVDGFIAGCTEVHLHTRDLLASGIRVIDPLYILAQRIAEPVLPLISQIDAR